MIAGWIPSMRDWIFAAGVIFGWECGGWILRHVWPFKKDKP